MKLSQVNTIQSNHTEEFKTRDIYLATALKQAGIPIIRVENYHGKGIFVFVDSRENKNLVMQFFNGDLRSDPRGLFETFKSMKSLAYSMVNDVR